MTLSRKQGHERSDLPQLCEPLAVGLGLIESGMVLRVPCGYILPGANATISVNTIERLQALGPVRPHPQYGRKTTEPTTLGLRTLAAREGRIRPMQQQATRHWKSGSLHEAAPSSVQSVQFPSHREILEPLGEITGALLAQWQSIRMWLAHLHAGTLRLGSWSRSVLPFDHGADVTPTQPADSFVRKLRQRSS